MTLLADGTLTVNRAVDISVARQTSSLPSSSSSTDRVGSASTSSTHEGEGTAFAVKLAEDVGTAPVGTVEDTVNIAATQAQQAEATKQTKPQVESTEEESQGSNPAELNPEDEKERFERITKELNSKLDDNLALRFGEDKETGQGFFQLVERESGEVVRQVPSEEILEFMKRFQSFSGLLFSQQA